jgi:uncharacterized protein YdeI (YjbR/CyaY-like superfamily)
MQSKALTTLEIRTRDRWRAWLAAHHDTEPGVWLVFHKVKTGRPSMAYSDALDEALCFGWVDSLVKRLDDERYARKFTPRRPDSVWSAINRRRYAELAAAGRLAAPGKARPPTDRHYGPRPALPARVPPDMREALKRVPRAARFFEGLAPSERKRFVGWVALAKKAATRRRRLAEAIRLLAAGRRLGLK